MTATEFKIRNGKGKRLKACLFKARLTEPDAMRLLVLHSGYTLYVCDHCGFIHMGRPKSKSNLGGTI